MYGSHLATLGEILEVSHHLVIQQTWIGYLLGARHGTELWDRDLSKYITPWPGGVHTQQGFSDRSQYGVVGHAGAEGTQKPLSQARGG